VPLLTTSFHDDHRQTYARHETKRPRLPDRDLWLALAGVNESLPLEPIANVERNDFCLQDLLRFLPPGLPTPGGVWKLENGRAQMPTMGPALRLL
jgi:hypothetical protein